MSQGFVGMEQNELVKGEKHQDVDSLFDAEMACGYKREEPQLLQLE